MIKEKVFLAGGGDEKQSASFDSLYVNELGASGVKRIIYIPNALPKEKHEKAGSWFKSIFSKKVEDIEMFDNLSQAKVLSPSRDSVYLGGGNTARLMEELRSSGFDKKLTEFAQSGGVVYGGSAGAIVLGADIRTAPEVKESKTTDFKGLDLLGGRSVGCHFKGTEEEVEDYLELRGQINTPIMLISEESGVLLKGGKVEVVGENGVRLI